LALKPEQIEQLKQALKAEVDQKAQALADYEFQTRCREHECPNCSGHRVEIEIENYMKKQIKDPKFQKLLMEKALQENI
jgi:excinuclease UvrABC ATPase subunit